MRPGAGLSVTALAACLAAAGALAADAGTEWPTVQHDFLRSGYTHRAPAPPYRVRWVWTNGHRVDPQKVKGTRGFSPDLLPDFVGVRFMSLSQPMAAGGAAYIGSIEGDLYAIDVASGRTKWKAPASGPILHSVTVGAEAVYAATLRGVDAFDLAGRKRWTFEDPRRGGFWACPALASGRVLIGGLSGTFYALDALDGRPAWQFKAPAAIYQTPAAHDGSVFFGAEDMHAYCLDVRTGKRKWRSDRLAGVTFGHTWPVVAAKAGAVMFRTSGFEHGHGSGMDAVAKAPQEYRGAQDALRRHLQDHPHARSFFVLNLSDGRQKVFVACGYFGSQADIPPPPIVRGDGAALAWHYAKDGAFQPKGRFAHYASPVDFGQIDFRTGLFRRLGPIGSLKYPAIVRFDDFHSNTMGGRYLFGMQAGLHWGCVPLDARGPTFGATFHNHLNRFRQSGKRGSVGYLGRNEHGAVAPTILTDVVLVNPMNGVCILAYESAAEK